MGNITNQPQNSEIVTTFRRENWLRYGYTNNGELMRNQITGNLAEVYQLHQIPNQQVMKMLQFRSKANDLVNVYNLVLNANQNLCSKNQLIEVYIEYIPLRLSDVNDLTLEEALTVLKSAFHGFNTISMFYCLIEPKDQLIGFNEHGKTKVWLAENFSLNHQLFKDANSNDQDDKIKTCSFVRKVYDMIENKTVGKMLPIELKQIFRRRNPNYFEAVELLEDFADQNNLNLSKYYRMNQIRKRNASSNFTVEDIQQKHFRSQTYFPLENEISCQQPKELVLRRMTSANNLLCREVLSPSHPLQLSAHQRGVNLQKQSIISKSSQYPAIQGSRVRFVNSNNQPLTILDRKSDVLMSPIRYEVVKQSNIAFVRSPTYPIKQQFVPQQILKSQELSTIIPQLESKFSQKVQKYQPHSQQYDQTISNPQNLPENKHHLEKEAHIIIESQQNQNQIHQNSSQNLQISAEFRTFGFQGNNQSKDNHHQTIIQQLNWQNQSSENIEKFQEKSVINQLSIPQQIPVNLISFGGDGNNEDFQSNSYETGIPLETTKSVDLVNDEKSTVRIHSSKQNLPFQENSEKLITTEQLRASIDEKREGGINQPEDSMIRNGQFYEAYTPVESKFHIVDHPETHTDQDDQSSSYKISAFGSLPDTEIEKYIRNKYDPVLSSKNTMKLNKVDSIYYAMDSQINSSYPVEQQQKKHFLKPNFSNITEKTEEDFLDVNFLEQSLDKRYNSRLMEDKEVKQFGSIIPHSQFQEDGLNIATLEEGLLKFQSSKLSKGNAAQQNTSNQEKIAEDKTKYHTSSDGFQNNTIDNFKRTYPSKQRGKEQYKIERQYSTGFEKEYTFKKRNYLADKYESLEYKPKTNSITAESYFDKYKPTKRISEKISEKIAQKYAKYVKEPKINKEDHFVTRQRESNVIRSKDMQALSPILQKMNTSLYSDVKEIMTNKMTAKMTSPQKNLPNQQKMSYDQLRSYLWK